MWLQRHGGSLFVGSMCLFVVSPFVAQYLNFSESFAKLLTAFIMPTYHLLCASAVGLYILLATTGQGNKSIDALLSCRFWKPLARLSLCVVLVNVEVVAYIIQTHRNFQLLNNQYHTCLNLLSILTTYLAATVVCVLFEAPMRAALNQLMAFAMQQRAASAKKRQQKSA